MTYSIAAKCPRTGMFGAAVTTSSIGVGARCAYARAGVGAVLTQHRTDPRLGPKGLELLAQGLPAKDVLERLTRGVRASAAPARGDRQRRTHRRVPRRQDHLGALGDAGPGCIAIGNIIRTTAVTPPWWTPSARIRSYISQNAGARHGSGVRCRREPKQVKSAALLVVERESFPLIDLRVDFDPQPLVQLRWLWEIYEPSVKLYVDRAVNPDSEPGPA
jgi:uncharacterized Ntn-hydrolase superfamily protein